MSENQENFSLKMDLIYSIRQDIEDINTPIHNNNNP